MLQLFVTEKDRVVTFAIDGIIEAAAEKSLSACITEILAKRPIAVNVHFCNLSRPEDGGLRLLELLGVSLAKEGAKVFLSGFDTETKDELIRRGKLNEQQIFDSIQSSREAATAASKGR